MSRSSKRTDSEKVLPILIPVIGEERALAIIELRDIVKREPITEYAAKLLVKQYLATGNPEDAADMQILHSWRGFDSAWYLNEVRKKSRCAPSPPPRTPFQQRHQNAIDAFDQYLGVSRNDEFTGDTIDVARADYRAH